MVTEMAITQMDWTRLSRGAETLAAVLHRPFEMTREKNITCHGLLAPDRSGRSYGGIVPSEYLAPGGNPPHSGLRSGT